MNKQNTFAQQPGWHWRNCRSVGISFGFWVWPWVMSTYRTDDAYGGERGFHLGPISLGISYSIGNASSTGLDRFTALDGQTALDRAAKWEQAQ